jgi:hypothetical protein
MTTLAVVVHKMLWSSNNTDALKSLDKSDAESRVEKHIFSIAFLSASPALVAADVYNGSIYLAYAHCTQFFGDNETDLMVKVSVKGCGHRDTLWKAGCVAPLGSVKSLAVLKNRDAPTAGLN